MNDCKKSNSILESIGVYGYSEVETLILSSLVTYEPIILIGETGTGKTFLLNNLARVLGLRHKHYNASLVSFEDLIGFPYPDKTGNNIKYLQTEASVWDAESILVDEISRCQPSVQNKLFSLIYEKKLLGIELKDLRYAWAAMNPPTTSDDDENNIYLGSEALDIALADRFSLFIDSPSWENLSSNDKKKIVSAESEFSECDVNKDFINQIEKARKRFNRLIKNIPDEISEYSKNFTDIMNKNNILISPRRAYKISVNLTGIMALNGNLKEADFINVVEHSIPNRCFGKKIDKDKIMIAHKTAMMITREKNKMWLYQFFTSSSIKEKIEILIKNCKNEEEGNEAILEFIRISKKEELIPFCFIVYPAAVIKLIPAGIQAVNEMGKIAMRMYDFKYKESYNDFNDLAKLKEANLSMINDKYRENMAEKFLFACLKEGIDIKDPQKMEEDIYQSARMISNIINKKEVI
ncbi:MAG: AAA domain-containing protein [Elusimicrobia bacterium]|nr:AAA domain-containing protein [Elusimicrobiota bacterium]